jgi:hypothetical protein
MLLVIMPATKSPLKSKVWPNLMTYLILEQPTNFTVNQNGIECLTKVETIQS